MKFEVLEIEKKSDWKESPSNVGNAETWVKYICIGNKVSDVSTLFLDLTKMYKRQIQFEEETDNIAQTHTVSWLGSMYT